jgi:hypothetical protein
MPELLNNFQRKRDMDMSYTSCISKIYMADGIHHADEADDTSDVSMIYLLFFC